MMRSNRRDRFGVPVRGGEVQRGAPRAVGARHRGPGEPERREEPRAPGRRGLQHQARVLDGRRPAVVTQRRDDFAV